MRFKDQLYSFASAEGAINFAKDPESILHGVINVVRKQPELIQILKLHRHFPTVAALEMARSAAKRKLLGQMPVVFDAGCQSDTHIIDSYIDPNYEWNEWTMRRTGLMLVGHGV